MHDQSNALEFLALVLPLWGGGRSNSSNANNNTPGVLEAKKETPKMEVNHSVLYLLMRNIRRLQLGVVKEEKDLPVNEKKASQRLERKNQLALCLSTLERLVYNNNNNDNSGNVSIVVGHKELGEFLKTLQLPNHQQEKNEFDIQYHKHLAMVTLRVFVI